MNLPTLGVSGAILLVAFHGQPGSDKPWRQQVREFDFVSLFFVASGTALLCVGFDAAQSDWGSSETMACLVVGFACFAATAVNIIWFTSTRQPLFPKRLFTARSPLLILFASLGQSIVFIGAIFYLPFCAYTTPSL